MLVCWVRSIRTRLAEGGQDHQNVRYPNQSVAIHILGAGCRLQHTGSVVHRSVGLTVRCFWVGAPWHILRVADSVSICVALTASATHAHRIRGIALAITTSGKGRQRIRTPHLGHCTLHRHPMCPRMGPHRHKCHLNRHPPCNFHCTRPPVIHPHRVHIVADSIFIQIDWAPDTVTRIATPSTRPASQWRHLP